MWSFVSRTRISAAIILVLSLGGLPAYPAESAPKVYLDITKEAGRKIVLAAAPFAVDQSREEAALHKVLENDLSMTGHIQLLPWEELQRELFQIESESDTQTTESVAN